MMRKLAGCGLAVAFGIAMTLVASSVATAQSNKLRFGPIAGPPPIFAAVIGYVAHQQDFFKKHGLEVEMKSPESGTAAARALVSGDIDVAMAPSALTINQISNADADVVALWGMPHPSHLLATTDGNAECKDAKGQPVGIDVIGGARANSLRLILASCGVKIEEVQQVALVSTATMQAMVADRLKFGILHFDEIPVIEQQGKPVKIIARLVDVNPNSHFLVLTARKSEVAKNRDAYVRFVAAIIDTARFMRDPKNVDRVAEIATVTTRTKEQAKAAMATLNQLGYWPADDDGLDQKKLEAVTQTMVRVGNIRPGKTPVSYERLVDRSVWQDAVKLVEKK
ncbi:MAG TPA: ABC transporter substrate-binding protein [Xanthobacteraceae bacterium]|nr:ABC transporter substrate-binding protein [Xanthobacteraceae bacterium]